MSQAPFNIDDEIDKLVDKFGEEMKTRLKKLVVRSEKQVLKAHMLAQAQQQPKKPSTRFEPLTYSERSERDRKSSSGRGGSSSSRSYRRDYSDDDSEDERDSRR